MANRQHGRGRSPSGGRSPSASRNTSDSRNPSGGRAARATPVSWAPAGTPVYTEPEVRRWPHPLEDGTAPAAGPEPALHYIRCALSYQNQMLADIKALLEQLAADRAVSPETAAAPGGAPAVSQEKG